MMVNQNLLQILRQKNPELSFGLEESFPMEAFYGESTPLGPITKLPSEQEKKIPLSPELAARSLDFWRNKAGELMADSNFHTNEDMASAYGKMVTSQGNLFANQKLIAQAEEAYRLAQQMAPKFPEPTTGLATLLAENGRVPEAIQALNDFAWTNPDFKATGSQASSLSGWLDNFARTHPEQRGALDKFRQQVIGLDPK